MAARAGWGRWAVALAVILVAGGAVVWARAAAPRTAAGLQVQRTTADRHTQRTTAPLPQAQGATTHGTGSTAGAGGGGTADETGGAPGVVRAYFADLSDARYEAAYALLSPTWQATHPYAEFAQQLPEAALQLLTVRIVSEANFHAAVAWTAKAPSGGTVGGTARLVNVRVGTTPPAGSPWRMEAPPVATPASSSH